MRTANSRHEKPIGVRIKRGHMNSRAAAEHKINVWPVEHKPGRLLIRAPLQKMRGLERTGGRIEHGEERAHRAVGVDIVRAVKRIDCDEQGPVRIQDDGVRSLFREDRADPSALQPVYESSVGKHVERFLSDSVVSGADLGLHSPGENAAADAIGDRERRARDRAQHLRPRRWDMHV